MELLYVNEHLDCYNYDHTEKPHIEVVKLVKGQGGEMSVNTHEFIFFMEGRLRYLFRDFPQYEGAKGQAVFLPAGGTFSYEALSNCMLMVFRIDQPINLCENFPVEKLHEGKVVNADEHKPHTRRFSSLDINPRLWYFLDGLNDCLSDGIKCRCFFETKTKELLLLLRAYYTKEDLYDFLYLILSRDTAFSEYVRLRWRRFKTVSEMAGSMNLTPKQFSTKFREVFGKTPYQWMIEGKARILYQEITSTRKPFKRIAFENGFSTIAQFTKFCKKELGKTPTDIRFGPK